MIAGLWNANEWGADDWGGVVVVAAIVICYVAYRCTGGGRGASRTAELSDEGYIDPDVIRALARHALRSGDVASGDLQTLIRAAGRAT